MTLIYLVDLTRSIILLKTDPGRGTADARSRTIIRSHLCGAPWGKPHRRERARRARLRRSARNRWPLHGRLMGRIARFRVEPCLTCVSSRGEQTLLSLPARPSQRIKSPLLHCQIRVLGVDLCGFVRDFAGSAAGWCRCVTACIAAVPVGRWRGACGSFSNGLRPEPDVIVSDHPALR